MIAGISIPHLGVELRGRVGAELGQGQAALVCAVPVLGPAEIVTAVLIVGLGSFGKGVAMVGTGAKDMHGPAAGALRDRRGTGFPDEHVQVLPLGRLRMRLRRVDFQTNMCRSFLVRPPHAPAPQAATCLAAVTMERRRPLR